MFLNILNVALILQMCIKCTEEQIYPMYQDVQLYDPAAQMGILEIPINMPLVPIRPVLPPPIPQRIKQFSLNIPMPQTRLIPSPPLQRYEPTTETFKFLMKFKTAPTNPPNLLDRILFEALIKKVINIQMPLPLLPPPPILPPSAAPPLPPPPLPMQVSPVAVPELVPVPVAVPVPVVENESPIFMAKSTEPPESEFEYDEPNILPIYIHEQPILSYLPNIDTQIMSPVPLPPPPPPPQPLPHPSPPPPPLPPATLPLPLPLPPSMLSPPLLSQISGPLSQPPTVPLQEFGYPVAPPPFSHLSPQLPSFHNFIRREGFPPMGPPFPPMLPIPLLNSSFYNEDQIPPIIQMPGPIITVITFEPDEVTSGLLIRVTTSTQTPENDSPEEIVNGPHKLEKNITDIFSLFNNSLLGIGSSTQNTSFDVTTRDKDLMTLVIDNPPPITRSISGDTSEYFMTEPGSLELDLLSHISTSTQISDIVTKFKIHAPIIDKNNVSLTHTQKDVVKNYKDLYTDYQQPIFLEEIDTFSSIQNITITTENVLRQDIIINNDTSSLTPLSSHNFYTTTEYINHEPIFHEEVESMSPNQNFDLTTEYILYEYIQDKNDTLSNSLLSTNFYMTNGYIKNDLRGIDKVLSQSRNIGYISSTPTNENQKLKPLSKENYYNITRKQEISLEYDSFQMNDLNPENEDLKISLKINNMPVLSALDKEQKIFKMIKSASSRDQTTERDFQSLGYNEVQELTNLMASFENDKNSRKIDVYDQFENNNENKMTTNSIVGNLLKQIQLLDNNEKQPLIEKNSLNQYDYKDDQI